MSRNRYVKDYRLVETFDERGKVKTGYEYIGSPYAFAGGAAKAARAKKTALAACIVGWLAYVGALLPVSAAMHTFYVSLPFVFAAVPLALLTGTVLGVMNVKGTMEHRHADRLENRYPACAFFLVALTGASLAGEAVNLLRGAALGMGDLAFSLCAALLIACGLAAHRQREALKCREIS